jgi:hypothetical protein
MEYRHSGSPVYGGKKRVDGKHHSVASIGGSNPPPSPNGNWPVEQYRRENIMHVGDGKLIFSSLAPDRDIELVVSAPGNLWIEAKDRVGGGKALILITATELRVLADALAPYQTPRVANDLVAEPVVHQADRFCHTCGTKTFENKPRNDAPTFLAPRHGHDGLGG